MAQKFFNAGQGINFGPQVQPPINPVDGDIYYNVTLGALQFYSKGQWFSFTQAEYDNGTSTLDTVVIDLSKGQLQKINLSPLAPTLTLKLVNGVVGNQYKIKVSFDDSCNYVTPVQIFSSQPLSGASQIYAKPNSRVLLTCTQTSAGVRYTTETYDAFVSTHLYDSLATGIGIVGASSDSSSFFGYLYNGLPYIFGESSYGVQATVVSSNAGGLYIPTPVSPVLGRSYSSLCCGYNTVFAIEASTGYAWAWGNGGAGVLTAGAYSAVGPTYTPTQISGNRSWRAIYSGCTTVAIEASTGYAWTWGYAATGQLGMYSTVDVSSPVSVLGGRSFTVASVGWGFPSGLAGTVAAIEGSTGRAWTWGASDALGTGATSYSSSPVSVLGGRSYSYINSNSQSAAAIEGSTGYAWTWGTSSYGMLGSNNATAVGTSPISVAGGRSFTKVIASNDYYSSNPFMLAIEGSTGFVYTWGSQGTYLQLGTGAALYANASSPVAVLGRRSFSDIRGVPQGALAFEASTGAIYGWGNVAAINRYPKNYYIPYPVDPLTHGNRFWSQVALSDYSSFGIEGSTGLIYGWGRNSDGQTATGTKGADVRSPLAITLVRSFSQVHSGGPSTVAIEASTGRAWAWGSNSYGELGNGSQSFFPPISVPTAVSGARSYRQVTYGNYGKTAFGLEAATGLIYGWGENSIGVVGNGAAVNVSVPTVISGGRSYKQVTSLLDTTCALEGATGRAWTWGLNGGGSLGNNSLTASNVPVSVWGGRSYNQVATVATSGAWAAFAAIEGSTGYIWTWGRNDLGQLGNGAAATAHALSPVLVSGGRSYSKISSSFDAFYAVEGSSGLLYAWGNNNVGQCGAGFSTTSPVSTYNIPVRVASGKSWKNLPPQASNAAIGTALDSGNVLYYWGGTDPYSSSFSPNTALGLGTLYATSPVSIARYNPKW